jgi:hypothetical protein
MCRWSTDRKAGMSTTMTEGDLQEGIDVKSPSLRGIGESGPVDWMCGALDVPHGEFYAWLKRPRNRRCRSHDKLGANARGRLSCQRSSLRARRVWMRLQVRKARPRRRRPPPDLGERQVTAVAANVLDAPSRHPLPTANGLLILPTCGPRKVGSVLLRSPTPW